MTKNLLCIGHRGAAGHAPENTLASMRKALEFGVHWIELDVYALDGELVVFHDDRLERCTNGSGNIGDHSFSSLRALDAGDGEQIPTLGEVFELVAGRAGLNIELKDAAAVGPVVSFVQDAIATGWAIEKIIISSDDRRQLEEVKQLDSSLRIGVVMDSRHDDNAASAEQLDAYSVHPSLNFVDREFVDDAHARGLQVYVFTVNDPDDIARMVEMGVDGVFTDYPERVIA